MLILKQVVWLLTTILFICIKTVRMWLFSCCLSLNFTLEFNLEFVDWTCALLFAFQPLWDISISVNNFYLSKSYFVSVCNKIHFYYTLKLMGYFLTSNNSSTLSFEFFAICYSKTFEKSSDMIETVENLSKSEFVRTYFLNYVLTFWSWQIDIRRSVFVLSYYRRLLS